jgi:hypothetical protein
VKKPIVYYLDPGTPEPTRSALLEGARWWAQAFEAAGFKDAFRVELRPADVHTLDARYNVINWVHRSTRGWSTGGAVIDPRSGEIIKGVVTLGSLRVRQDYLIAEGLLAPYAKGDENPPELAEWALARLRQLSAHEVGHTLGLSHNYYDSELGRISVMDYPHPLVTLKADGTLDASSVYARGAGEWDKLAIAWGYQEFPAGADESRALAALLDEAWKRDVRFLTNQDIEAHPRADWWSNGVDAAAELLRMLEVRRAALARFGENAVRRGRPLATIEETLVPLYLHHRYQVEAAASVLGGQHYVYAMRGDGRQPTRRASANEQAAALEALMRTLDPAELRLRVAARGDPTAPVGLRPAPRALPALHGTGLRRRLAGSGGGRPHRLAASRPGAGRAPRRAEGARPEPARARRRARPAGGRGGRGVGALALRGRDRTGSRAGPGRALMALAGAGRMAQVRALASEALQSLARSAASGDRLEAAHASLLAQDIRRFLERPAASLAPPSIPAAPPGPPIGEPALDYLRSLEPLCSLEGGR